MVIIIMYMCMYYRILNSYNNDKNIKSLFFFKFSRWHDNVSADADDDHNNCWVRTLFTIATMASWGAQCWKCHFGENHLFRTCDFFLFKCSLIFFLWLKKEKLKLCHTSYKLFNRNMLWLGFVIVFAFYPFKEAADLMEQKNGWLSWGSVQTNKPKTCHPCVFAFVFVFLFAFVFVFVFAFVFVFVFVFFLFNRRLLF